MRTTCCLMVLLFLRVASADAQTLATLRVKSEKIEGGIVTLVLQSGNEIEILESDLYGLVKGGAPAAPAGSGALPPVNVVPQAPSTQSSRPLTQDPRLTITDNGQRGPGIIDPTSSPSASDIQGTIRAHCTKEWPTDYRMQAYCLQQQNESVVKMGQRFNAGFTSTPEGRTITLQCFKEWPTDYRMQNYCVEQQLEGLKKLGR